jgi:hypothetical protein
MPGINQKKENNIQFEHKNVILAITSQVCTFGIFVLLILRCTKFEVGIAKKLIKSYVAT